MGNYRYITNRVLKNNRGEEAGNIKARVRNDSDKVEGFYECPECMHKGTINQGFRRPLNVKCDKCGFLMRLPKLKDEMKKEKKKESK
jgi:hypothetical protein